MVKSMELHKKPPQTLALLISLSLLCLSTSHLASTYQGNKGHWISPERILPERSQHGLLPYHPLCFLWGQLIWILWSRREEQLKVSLWREKKADYKHKNQLPFICRVDRCEFSISLSDLWVKGAADGEKDLSSYWWTLTLFTQLPLTF